jgi:uncharacterized protein with NRDE domain
VLDDIEEAPDEQLPDTGLEHKMEKALSAMCIRTPHYGTCCSTALTIRKDGQVSFIEKTYPVGDRVESQVSFEFQIEK